MSDLVLPAVLLAEITLIAGLALVACRIWRHDAAARYGVGLTAMVLLWLAVPLTLILRAAGFSTLLWRETLYTVPLTDVPVATTPPETSSQSGLLIGLWAAGAALILARLAFGFLKVRRLRRTASPLPHLKGAAPVFVTEEVSGPVVVGALKPSVLIPSSVLDGLSETELADVLAHEFAHVARRHLLVAIAQRLTVALLWPHPFVHFLSRQIVEAREEVCDNVVLGSAGRARYARILLRVAECRRPSGHFSASLGLFGPESHLEKRVKSLLDPHRRISTEMNFPRIATVTALMLLGVGAFAGARIETEIVSAAPLDGAELPARAAAPQTVKKQAPKSSRSVKINVRTRKSQKRAAEKVLVRRRADIELSQRKMELDRARLDVQQVLRERQAELENNQAQKALVEQELKKAKGQIDAARDQVLREKEMEAVRRIADEAKRKALLDRADVEKARQLVEEELRKAKNDADVAASERDVLKKALADRERALEQMRKELEKAKAEAEKAKKKKGDDESFRSDRA